MLNSTHSSPIEIFTADEAGRQRHWSDQDDVRIVEESYRGMRQGSASARCYDISRSLVRTDGENFGNVLTAQQATRQLLRHCCWQPALAHTA